MVGIVSWVQWNSYGAGTELSWAPLCLGTHIPRQQLMLTRVIGPQVRTGLRASQGAAGRASLFHPPSQLLPAAS